VGGWLSSLGAPCNSSPLANEHSTRVTTHNPPTPTHQPRQPQVDQPINATEAALAAAATGPLNLTVEGLPQPGGFAIGLRLVRAQGVGAALRMMAPAPGIERALRAVREKVLWVWGCWVDADCWVGAACWVGADCGVGAPCWCGGCIYGCILGLGFEGWSSCVYQSNSSNWIHQPIS